MSIQTELTRIINAKTAIKTAIEGKGVDVPSGAKLDALASLIESIEAGGGASLQYGRLKKAASGTFTPAERTGIDEKSPYTLQHNAGVVPLLILITADNTKALGDLYFLACWRIPKKDNYNDSLIYTVSARRASSSSSASTQYGEFGTYFNINVGNSWNTESAQVLQNRTSLYLNTGITYDWMVYTFE